MSRLCGKPGKTPLSINACGHSTSRLCKHVPRCSLLQDDSKFCPWHICKKYGVATNLTARPSTWCEKARVRFDANGFSSSKVIAVMPGSTRTGSSNGGGHGIRYCRSITAVLVAFVGRVCESPLTEPRGTTLIGQRIRVLRPSERRQMHELLREGRDHLTCPFDQWYDFAETWGMRRLVLGWEMVSEGYCSRPHRYRPGWEVNFFECREVVNVSWQGISPHIQMKRDHTVVCVLVGLGGLSEDARP
ncbi:hypothetical protein GE21DRAFT_2237 [Neurospora crassa]|uniref:Uncharacterized protein n=1 Tax=Neurospora crassa (strain ATCC 24698 / 74-OR23-1A / CBS 708.71 / DSM 1257 / FGSC 987) TaxID=367110 RepID=V5IRR5_NEUCR|nr:hypothetical protein NCU16459 [Neurospora crassa OR74A]ESA44336.1 hypothetical protein NCU16459 [Neurospora crassa OR74A]KHE85074.1 hypothetical protein GE21DRAFT_2237 [Neurospora crassa]|eukprot:XP_011393426.1 hypothetical protein NCU16459 [Neurospora crassa OR74A]